VDAAAKKPTPQDWNSERVYSTWRHWLNDYI
jgi:hypothetical protein